MELASNETCEVFNYSKAVFKCCQQNLWPPLKSADWSSTYSGVSLGVTAFVGVILNAFTLVALSGSKTLLRKPATSFVLNLALTDLIFCLVVLPVDAATYLTEYTWSSVENSSIPDGLPEAVCFFSGLTKHAAPAIDWTTLALIALERYCKIVVGSEAHTRFFRHRYKRLMIASLWILGWTVLGVFGNYGFSKKAMRCTLKAATHKWQFIHRGQFSMVWMMLVIVVIIVTCLRIWKHVRESSAAIVTFSRRSASNRNDSDVVSDSSFCTSDCAAMTGIGDTGGHVRDIRGINWQTSDHPGESSPLNAPASRGRSVDSNSESSCQRPGRLSRVSLIQKTADLASRLTALRHLDGRRGDPPESGRAEERLERVFVKRDLSLVKMIAITTGTYIFLVTPMTILNVVDSCGQEPDLRNLLYALYVWLYVVNFFIYVRTNAVYRQSCVNLIKKICPLIK